MEMAAYENEKEENIEMDQSEILIENVKKEVKKLMEEAVTRKFIHTDSSYVTSLCGAVDDCVIHKLRKRVGGLFSSSDNSLDVLSKVAKDCPEAESILKLTTYLYQFHETKSNFPLFEKNTISESDLKTPEKKRLNGYTSSRFSTKYLWIRLALLEKVLATIVQSLVAYSRELYESDALLADRVNAPVLVALLDGPCSLDYSKMKTPENSWADPSAQELVQRHKIYRSPSQNGNSTIVTPNRRRLFMSSPKLNSSIPGVPVLARQHVDSLHQNIDTQLLYGKNNVSMSLGDTTRSLQGYLSLHKSLDSLLLKWTPNPMLYEDDNAPMNGVTSGGGGGGGGGVGGEKCQFWNQAITVDFVDVVYLHCHSTGDSGGSVVLISQDGVQLPPLSFPSGGSLLSFLTCLEQGLSPEGRLDPPLLQKNNSLITWPKLKKSVIPDRLVNAFQDQRKDEDAKDFVFRVVFTSNIDKAELRKLLQTSGTPNKLKFKAQRNETEIPFASRTQMSRSKFQRSYGVPSKIALNLACEKMKHQILARAFHGWVASYRHMKTVRTHLASLVLHNQQATEELPHDVHQGLTHISWTEFRKQGLERNQDLIRQYVYYGGIEPSIRKEVWPYILDQYPFTSDASIIRQVEATDVSNYAHILEECKGVEKLLQEKERDLLALNGFANGEIFHNHHHGDLDSEDVDISVTNETTEDNVSRDFSISSNISDPIPDVIGDRIDGGGRGDGAKETPWIRSLLDTKDNLREMVESASERGSTAWKNLMRKRGHARTQRKHEKPSDTFSGLHEQVSQPKSFDLELDCKTCGKKVIESRLRVTQDTQGSSHSDGNDNNANIDSIECFACMQERINERYEQEISPYKAPVSVVVEHKHNNGASSSDYVVNINGEGTRLLKRTSFSSVESTYSENVLKDYALNIHRIDKDVLRCDRNYPYFSSEENLEKLRNVIMCYVWEKLNIGYIQGMCDLCAPLLVVMDDEAKVYACFVKLMAKMEHNFPHGTQMDRHLANINSLIQILDPELHEILDMHGDNTIFYFCYRWFLLDFKRELQYEDIFLVWETIWAASSTTSETFNLFVGLAMIELYREIIIDNHMDFTDIIKFFNEMAEQHDVKATLDLARNIVTKLQDIMHPNDAELALNGEDNNPGMMEYVPEIESMEIEG